MTQPIADLMLQFGSRSGSWFAVALFGSIFALLGFLNTRAIRQRAPEAGLTFARVVGLVFFLGPLALVWITSLGGFYELELTGNVVHLRYLTHLTDEIPAADVASVTARPAFKGRWRLEIIDRAGRRFESATWYREPVHDSASQLTKALAARK